MKKRRIIRIISYISAFAVVFAASGMLLNKAKAAYEDVLGRVRLSGLTSLCEYVHDMSSGLRILAVSANENVSDAAAFVTSRTMGALGSIACFESVNTENIATFLNGVMGFAEKFSDSIDEEQRKTALDFSDYAQELYYHLSDVANAVVSGEYSLVENKEIYKKSDAEYFENKLDFANGRENEIFSYFADASAKVMQTYDKALITEQEAKENAAAFLDIHAQLLRSDGEKNYKGVQIYRFYHNETTVNVCRYGGGICSVETSHLCTGSELSFVQAEKAAESLMKKLGCGDFEIIHSENNDFSVRFVMAPVINGILFLPATVNTEICLGECAIIGFDASGLALNYPANLEKLTETADVSKVIPENLVFQKSSICYAEIDGAEKYCYLAECLFGDEKVFIFIDYYSLRTLKTVIL